MNRSEEYLILLLSQSEVKLYHAINNGILAEIKNEDFPIKNHQSLSSHIKSSDVTKGENMVREFLKQVDKAIIKVHKETEMNCIVFCTEDNYGHLMQVADKQSIYYGYSPLNHNDTTTHTLSAKAWQLIKTLQTKRRADAIAEMQEAIGHGKVITDLSEIFKAVKEGRGDLLITHEEFHQAVILTGDFTFELVSDVTLPNVIDDITSEIAWEVISKKGRALFTELNEIKAIGEIALKVRY